MTKILPGSGTAYGGAMPKSKTSFSRHSPDANSVSLHLRDRLGCNYTVQQQITCVPHVINCSEGFRGTGAITLE